jgi:AbrB family looped-hinge helix DNA binding protein
MSTLATTRMSSKGQVVIPEAIRRRLGLKVGDQFVVVGQRDAIILRTLEPPDLNKFRALIRKARKDARKAGLTQEHVRQAIRRARQRP